MKTNGRSAVLISACLLGVPAAPAAAASAAPNAVACTLVKTAAQLQAIKNNVTGSYCLANDIDLSSIANFQPIGTGAAPFTGNFFGNNHTISNLTIKSAATSIGLFGTVFNAAIQDVTLANVRVLGTSTGFVAGGGLVGNASGATASTIANVSVSGAVNIPCTPHDCEVGGIAGNIGLHTTITGARSAVNVATSGEWVGGLVGTMGDATALITRSSATGNVTCSASSPSCSAGGLVGDAGTATVTRSYATGNVTCGANCDAGGLVGDSSGTVSQSFATGQVQGGVWVGGLIGWNNAGIVQRSFSTGLVKGGGGASVGGLIGYTINGTLSELYAVSRVNAAGAGGLLGAVSGAPAVSNSYWDKNTTLKSTSAGGYGAAMTTAQLRAALPAGFGGAWAISKGRSYPFLNDFDLDFTPPLATLVISGGIHVFLPISQLDLLQYIGKPKHDDQAALATIYTMIARAIGIGDDVDQLKGVKINKYFWNDANGTTSWKGPVTSHAKLGPLKPLAGAISGKNVIAYIKVQRLVILRGTYTKAVGGTATHYMLATLVTEKPNGLVTTIVANDPWTGWQVEIDPATKTVVSPSNFPLKNFKVNAYQPVTVIGGPSD